MKKNLLKRIATCIVFPPSIFLILYYFKEYCCAVPVFIVFLAALKASKEMDNILFSQNEYRLIPYFIPPLLILIDWFGYFVGGDHKKIIYFALYSLISIIFLVEIFVGIKDEPLFKHSISRISKSVLLIIYPNSFMMFWSEIMNINEKGNLIFFFMLVLVFSNDIFCYVFGMLFGSNNRGYVKVSPNKSIAGYVAGIVLTPFIALVYTNIFKSVGVYFKNSIIVVSLAILTAIASDIGDLIESVFKRSKQIKDSSEEVIPGRGGMLDNIDSILSASTLFYFFTFLFL